MKTERLSFIWPAIRTFALLNQGQVIRCQPLAGPTKVVYLTEDDALACARMLRELGQGGSGAYECPRHNGARRQPHWHLTSRAGDGEEQPTTQEPRP